MRSNEHPSLHTELFLQPPAGQGYVRSFLFSRRIDAPFARVHLLARVILIFCLSLLQLRAIDTLHPDLLGTVLWGCLALALFLLSGISGAVARFYFLITLPALASLFLMWLLFNPVAGHVLLLRWPLYAGYLTFGTAHVPFFRPLTILISDRGLLVACTKVLGYSAMVLSTIVLVVTSRDVELIGVLRQLRLPQPLVFFLSTMFRSLDLAFSDFAIIRQAQRARALDARRRGVIRRLRDLALLAVPLVAVMIRRSSETGDALIARGYTLTRSGSEFYETSPWRALDWGVLVISIAMLYFALWHYVNITELLGLWR